MMEWTCQLEKEGSIRISPVESFELYPWLNLTSTLFFLSAESIKILKF